MELSDTLLCLFTAEVTRSDGDYVIRVPDREVETGGISPGDVYRVAVLSREPDSGTGDGGEAGEAPRGPQPPVESGEIRYVEIEDLGKQGDGIARVERGYVIIVPGGDVGERVKVEITEVRSNFAVGEIVEENFD